MKHKYYSSIKKKSGFTIIESLVYIFLTTIILSEGINLYVSMYKSYIDKENISIKYNNCQTFFISLDNIIAEGGFKEIIVDDNYILFSANNAENYVDKKVKSYDGKIAVKYTMGDVTETIKFILKDIDDLEVKKKGKLIYLIVRDEEGKEFVKCI